MSTLLLPTERITAAGCSRAVASAPAVEYGAGSAAEHAGTAGFIATAVFRGWGSNPAPVMAAQVKSTDRHLTPALRPEEASP